ncbi:MAG: hypothetical protein APF81_24945 [Desulfosporosinus sp. BRH_c37]|nr:MAG: hypothetical protein APF81_24945 [Desulfosporosinus sp. BRH_c37]
MVKKKLSLTRLPGSPLSFLDSLRHSFLWISEEETNKKLVTMVSLSQWIRNNLGWEKSSVQAARFIYSSFLDIVYRYRTISTSD